MTIRYIDNVLLLIIANFVVWSRALDEHPKPKTRYVMTPHRFINFTLPGILTDRMMDKLIGKSLGLLKK